MNPRCRIRTIKHKDSNLVEIVPRPRSDFRELMHQFTDQICDTFPEGLAAFTIVGLGFDGHWNAGTRIHKDAFFGATLFPALVAEVLRKRNMEDTAVDVFNEQRVL